MKKNKKLTTLSMLTASCLMLSFIEYLLPPLFPSVPGIKMGLANIVIIFALYTYSIKEAALISFVRITLSCLLFGGFMTFAYSVAGAFLSLLFMTVFKKTNLFSTIGISVLGGVMHNAGQIIVAMILMHTKQIGYYMIVLSVTGIISGILVGIAGAILTKRFKNKVQ